MKRLLILGATGSIGTQALDVVARAPGAFELVGLSADSGWQQLVAQAREHGVNRIALADPDAAAQAAEAWTDGEVLSGTEGLARLVAEADADLVLNAIVGSAGLGPTIVALSEGVDVALANKESLVLGGALVLAAARTPDQLVPVDSEHSALAQCLRGGAPHEVHRLILTASGGPFRGRSRAELEGITPAEALAHPTWDMGALVTVNSATLANKGLEVIEAHVLFGLPYERIDVVVHPQSVVHGMVEFADGATVAKLSPPDMRLPIQLALGWPERLDHAPARMDWTAPQSLTFEPVDHDTFPLLGLAVAAGREGGTAPGVYNAANEEAVGGFLAGRLPFLGIAAVVEEILATHEVRDASDLETVLAAEQWARTAAQAAIRRAQERT